MDIVSFLVFVIYFFFIYKIYLTSFFHNILRTLIEEKFLKFMRINYFLMKLNLKEEC